MNEEAQKRNTDCVYFLASPLTCKKGNECEYRHSEAARINPRDCWFWLSGSCLNANCPFRHPPLDGRPATTQPSTPSQTASATSAATSVAAPSAASKSVVVPIVASKSVAAPSTTSKTVTVPVVASKSVAAPSAASKSRVPCFFFSQGYCAKGDRCPFLHGQPAASSIEAAVYKKPPKAPALKGIEVSDKPVTLIKGNSSMANKETPQGLPFALERGSVAHTKSQSVLSKATVPSSVTSAPARRRSAISEDKTRQIHVSGDRSRPMQNVVDRSRQVQSGENRLQQPHPVNERHWQLQPADDKLRQGLSGEERKQNGFESEEWWKESSSSGFDVLPDRGPDRLILTEDGEYTPHREAESMKNRSGGRMMRPDDLTDFEYEVSGDYNQPGYYDTSGQRDPGSHEYHEQQLGHDHHGSFDLTGVQHSLPYNARPSEGALARDRRGIVVEQEMQHGSDLRDHLAKRRRNDRVQHLTAESSSRKVYQDAVSYHKRRHQDDHSKQEASMLSQPPSQLGARSNHRRPSGRVESGGIKRAHHESGSDYGSVSPDRVPLRSSPSKRPINDPSRLKLKDTDSGWYTSEATSIPEVSGYPASNSKKPEQKKEASNFAGPKSLAQIKAEKRRAEAENGFKAVEGLDGHKGMSGAHHNFPDERPLMVIKSQISSASDSEVDQVPKGISIEERKGRLNDELIECPDFEGPKSLSLVLKAKRELGGDGDVGLQEASRELALKRTSSTAGEITDKFEVSTAELLSLDTSKSVEDGEVLPDANNVITFSPEAVNGRKQKDVDSPNQHVSEMPIHASRFTSYIEKEWRPDEVQRNPGEKAKGEKDFYEDMMEDGIEAGGNASDEEYSFDDDEEDDDFAKKLGGFFS